MMGVGASLARRIALGTLAFLVAIYLIGIFLSAISGAYLFTVYAFKWIEHGFSLKLAGVYTDMDAHGLAFLDRTMVGALALGVPAGIAAFVASIRGHNVFSRKNWFGGP